MPAKPLSTLRRSGLDRLAVALLVSALIWLAIAWAADWGPFQ